MDERIGFGLYQSCGDRVSVGHVSVFWLWWCRWGVGRGLVPGSEAVGWIQRGGSTQFAQQLESTVTALPLVGCVVWSHRLHVLLSLLYNLMLLHGYTPTDLLKSSIISIPKRC